MKKHIAVLGFIAFIVLAMPISTFAQCGSATTPPNNPPCSTLGTVEDSLDIGRGSVGTGGTLVSYDSVTLVTTLLGLVNWLSWLIGVAAVVMGLYSGWLFITARDDASQLASARKTMLYAIIGIAVASISFGLIALSRSVLGL